MPIRFTELQDAFFFVSRGAPGEQQAFLDTQSGKVYWRSELAGDVDEEELPDDLDDERYFEVPHKTALGLGTHLVFDFVRQVLPGDYDEVSRIFSRRGAYGRYKALLERRRALDRWYDFSAKAEEAALRAWCAANAIGLSD